MKIHQALLELRKKTQLTQTEVANRINISQTYLSQIEGGSKEPSMEILKRISETYNVPIPILYFKMLTIDDVPKNKQRIFKELHPLINNLIDQIF